MWKSIFVQFNLLKGDKEGVCILKSFCLKYRYVEGGLQTKKKIIYDGSLKS